jgi:tRNA/tmRNA/rRNA uracil-C5-methylase (TrmA/RlmC/RlmD family)
MSYITTKEVNVYFVILLLSTHNHNMDYDLYWSQSEDCENRTVKAAVTRNSFRTIKKCIQFGSAEGRDWETLDKHKKVRMVVKHIKDLFSKLLVSERNLFHNEVMIKYFGSRPL